MLVNIIIGAAIFGYASWALVRYIKNSKKGKCAGCELENTCHTKSNCKM
ncbi:FeoB-associated Cys-rich membrane protein [Calidifontibacillus erzurumensis]|uniref:FeoB-associated Cys-rich membrane protein n=1 Tax=Calidifontibacillus erzurumensis TaxID=2741433 RepID=A0A8J8GFJ6_9BACI|nr:FeoB-associated Cys-rich membrane protein [Calidifontibacillus erzurumensis]NSL51498.1 FeoB-associated Cys-rich membrane protein [Calidifontibacillus erzurumensis]